MTAISDTEPREPRDPPGSGTSPSRTELEVLTLRDPEPPNPSSGSGRAELGDIEEGTFGERRALGAPAAHPGAGRGPATGTGVSPPPAALPPALRARCGHRDHRGGTSRTSSRSASPPRFATTPARRARNPGVRDGERGWREGMERGEGSATRGER